MADDWIPTDEILNKRAPAEYGVLRGFPSVERYSAWRYLGGGAFGTVFAGVHGGLGRIEAVKRIPIAEARVRHMALAETRVMAQLPPHPNLVTLFDAEESDDALFMTMQYLDGQPLDSLPLPVAVDRALAWTRDTAEALALVHAYGVVHRDIKPANVFRTRHDDGVLGDFGVARATDSRERTAAIAGTPAYMAPEAWIGAAGPASDLWSMGVMLYELLTGVRPFAACEGLAVEQMAEALTRARLEFPSVLRPGVPSRVDDLILQLLAPRPQDRLGSAMAVLDCLPRYDTVVSAMEADLTKLGVDAMVVSANERLSMSIAGSAAHAVATAGGPTVVEEARRQAPARIGTAVVTGAGHLPAKWVFHAVDLRVDERGYLVPAKEGDVRKALWACLRKAHELGVRSLALPAMGTYSGGLSFDEAARMMVDVVHTYLIEFRPPLERVLFAVSDKPVTIAFREAALARGMMLI
jgi:O-acetyl-ADP-ribose deacetylase (regulator of RNase III)